MPRNTSFKITKVTIKEKTFYRIRIPARFSKAGKREDMYYRSRSEARIDQEILVRKYQSGVIGAERPMTQAQQKDVSTAFELLNESGLNVSLTDAVKAMIEQHNARLRGDGISSLLVRYRDAVSGARNWSAKHADNWRFYSTRFDSRFGGMNVADVNQHDLLEWMSENFKSASYHNSAMSVLGPFFTWAVKQDIISKSPFDYIERKRITRNKAIDVFSVDEARRLLSCCRVYIDSEGHPLADENGFVENIYKLDCTDALVSFAFLLFAGIRPEELTRLTWDDVRTDEGYIHITPDVAKTSQVRHVVITDNLRLFIETVPERKRSGRVIPSNWKRKSRIVRKAAGLQGRNDTARHSFASYFLALHPDTDVLKGYMGHARNSDMLFKHYRAAVFKKDAKAYFAISPTM